ncbi:MAG: tRNA (adenosine(37)-N6)-dimethylallyltransferase MiaA [Actinomycetota bacterium]|nr:tRNA (adenosine(37)-N6)-dimethylallyltransferase MiaA [Actinomycetota bacterium]
MTGRASGGSRAPVALVGPTASGKSALAHAWAVAEGDVEIVTVDSMQVYRGMDIGTAKPTAVEQAEVRHHLLDVADPSEDFSLARFLPAARAAVSAIAGRGSRALLVGGTGLYVQALVDDLEVPGLFPVTRAEVEEEADTVALHARLAVLDPVAARRMEPTNRRRVVRALEVTLGSGRPFSSFGPGFEAYPPSPIRQVGLRISADVLDRRIEERVAAMVGAGLVAEVAALAAAPRGFSRTAGQALGYREVLAHLEGACSLDEAVALTVTRTRQLARRQLRWFRRDPRIRWVDSGDNPLPDLEPLLGDST